MENIGQCNLLIISFLNAKEIENFRNTYKFNWNFINHYSKQITLEYLKNIGYKLYNYGNHFSILRNNQCFTIQKNGKDQWHKLVRFAN